MKIYKCESKSGGDTMSNSEISDHPSSPKKRVTLTSVVKPVEPEKKKRIDFSVKYNVDSDDEDKDVKERPPSAEDQTRRDHMFAFLGITSKKNERKKIELKTISQDVPKQTMKAANEELAGKTCFNSRLIRSSSPVDDGGSPSASEGEGETELLLSDKSKKHLKKLEKALDSCARKIQKYEEAEIDWDKDDESNFIMADKLKKRYMEIYHKIAHYKKKAINFERKCDKKFVYSDSKYPDISND